MHPFNTVVNLSGRCAWALGARKPLGRCQHARPLCVGVGRCALRASPWYLFLTPLNIEETFFLTKHTKSFRCISRYLFTFVCRSVFHTHTQSLLLLINTLLMKRRNKTTTLTFKLQWPIRRYIQHPPSYIPLICLSLHCQTNRRNCIEVWRLRRTNSCIFLKFFSARQSDISFIDYSNHFLLEPQRS